MRSILAYGLLQLSKYMRLKVLTLTCNDLEGSPIAFRDHRGDHRRKLSRTESLASEISHIGEVGDLRKRLKAKQVHSILI